LQRQLSIPSFPQAHSLYSPFISIQRTIMFA
jgi:hypothetical protein